MVSRSRHRVVQPQQAGQRRPPVGIDGGQRRDVQAGAKIRMRRQFADRELQHAMVEQPHEAEVLRNRNDVLRRDDGAVGAADAHQAFVETNSARLRLHDRLIGDQHAPLVQRADDLVAGAHVFAPHALALDVRTVGGKRPAPLRLGIVRGFLRARQNFLHRARVARRDDATDGDRYGNRTCLGVHNTIANADQQPFGGNPDVVGTALLQHDAEFVAGVAAERVGAAHLGAQPLRDFRDHFVGNVIAVGFVDARQVVDRNEQEPARLLKLHRLVERLRQHRGQPPAVHLAGQRIELRQVRQMLFLGVTLVDDADNAMRAHRLAVRTGEPAADVFDPYLPACCAARQQTIFDLEQGAVRRLVLYGFHHRIETGHRGAGREQRRKAAAG